MIQSEERNTTELELRERVSQELARHQSLTQDCWKLFGIIRIVDSRHNFRTICAVRDDLRNSSKDLLRALNNLSKFPLGNTASVDLDGKRVKAVVHIEKIASRPNRISDLKSELAKSRTQLAERDKQIAALLDDGLRLAFKAEELEQELSQLRTRGSEFRL
jgi:hypothetical protein